MNRVTARTHAMKLIYEWEMGGEGGEETRLNLLGAQPGEEEYAFMERMFQGVVENVAALDESIEKNARGWKLERISRTALAVMRCAICEILYMDEIPNAAAINEAVELAKGYDEPDTVAFINGVLGGFMRGELHSDVPAQE